LQNFEAQLLAILESETIAGRRMCVTSDSPCLLVLALLLTSALLASLSRLTSIAPCTNHRHNCSVLELMSVNTAMLRGEILYRQGE